MKDDLGELTASLIALSAAAIRLLEQVDVVGKDTRGADFQDIVDAADRFRFALEPFRPPRPTI